MFRLKLFFLELNEAELFSISSCTFLLLLVYLQLVLNFLMLAIGGSLLSFSTIFHGIYFRNSLYDKLSAIIGLVVVFIINFFVEYDGIWAIFTVLTIIITFDCIFIFTKEEYDRFRAKRKAKRVE